MDTSSLDPKVTAQMKPECEYSTKKRTVTWKMKKLPAGIESCLRTRINLTTAASKYIRKEIGPIVMDFEVNIFFELFHTFINSIADPFAYIYIYTHIFVYA